MMEEGKVLLWEWGKGIVSGSGVVWYKVLESASQMVGVVVGYGDLGCEERANGGTSIGPLEWDNGLW
jgi:hypothetical protein